MSRKAGVEYVRWRFTALLLIRLIFLGLLLYTEKLVVTEQEATSLLITDDDHYAWESRPFTP